MAKRKDEEAQEEPGYCIGHWEKGNRDCEICEIQDECMALTADAGDMDDDDEEEDDDKEGDDGEKK